MPDHVSIKSQRQPVAVKVGEEWFIGMPTVSEELTPLSRSVCGLGDGMLYLERATKWIRFQQPSPQGQSITVDGMLPIPEDKVWIVVEKISACMDLSAELVKMYDRIMATRAGIHLA